MRQQPKVLFVGPSQSGKDTAALMYCEETGATYAGSMSRVIAPVVAERLGITADEAYERRHECRSLWFDIGNELRSENPTALLDAGFANGDVLTGARNKAEVQLAASLNLADLIVWVERPGVDVDPTLEFGWNDLDPARRYMVLNAGSLTYLRQEVTLLLDRHIHNLEKSQKAKNTA
jgi:hypothetical protein